MRRGTPYRIGEEVNKLSLSVLVGSAFIASVSVADVYTDPTGDIATGNPNLDITLVEVTDNGTDLTVSLTVDDLNADWGNYLLFLNLPGFDGSGDNDNPWGRNISGMAGTNYFYGSWLNDGGGVQKYEHIDDYWNFYGNSQTNFSIDWDSNTVTWTLANFVGFYSSTYDVHEIGFEVATTGGNWGDPAIDLLGGTGGNWGEGSTGAWNSYTFSTIPAPSVLALLCLGGLRQRRRL